MQTERLVGMPEPCTLQEVPIDLISTDEMKKTMYSRIERSINTLGRILQNVILVEQDGGTYTVYAGKRRVLAAKEAGLCTMPAMVFPGTTPKGVLSMFLISENMNRKQDPGLEAEALGNIMRSYNWTAKDIAKKLGILATHVSDRIKLLKRLIPEFLERLKEGVITLSAARKLCTLAPDVQRRLAGEEKLSIKRIEQETRFAKFDELIEQDELFISPALNTEGSLEIVKQELGKVIVTANGGGKLLREALTLIERYENRRQEGRHE